MGEIITIAIIALLAGILYLIALVSGFIKEKINAVRADERLQKKKSRKSDWKLPKKRLKL